MKVFFVAALFLALFAQPSFSQLSQSDSSLFDFWIGEWELMWFGKDSVKEYGVNSITKILDGTVLHENFTVTSGVNKGFKGQSVSVLESQTKIWKQTWVDNSGSYMSFTGGVDGLNRFFEREFIRNGATVKQKMIFRSVTKDDFVWDWTNSTDGGTNWNIAWSINYRRKK